MSKTDGAGPAVLDSVQLEVLRGALVSLANEVSVTLSRSAYSTNIKTRLDFSCAIHDVDGRVVAQAMNQPLHLGSLAHFVPRILASTGPLDPGEGVLCNDGHLGGLHLNDVCLLVPLHHEGKLLGYVASIAHHVDVGGGTPGSMGLHREIFQEGLIIPPVRLLKDGKVVDDILRLLLRNVRAERETGGDIRAQVAAAFLAQRRVTELGRRYGATTLVMSMGRVLEYTERRVRDELSRLPQGRWSAEDQLDDDGFTDVPIRIAVTVSVSHDGIEFDFSDSDKQRMSSLNTTFALTYAACAYALRVLLPADLDVNDGFYRFIRVVAPEGSVVNAVRPAAIGVGAETGHRICETVFKALGRVIPERLAADSKGTGCNIGFGGLDPRTGSYFVFYECQAGGYGARMELDGMDGIQPHTQNTENAPIEETEAAYPVQILRYSLITDSEGAGRRRGGQGIRRDYSPRVPVTFSVMADRAKFAPQGLQGGGPGKPSRFLRNPSGSVRRLPSKFTVELAAGEVISVQTGGGGGYGPAYLRDPEAVAADASAGRITRKRALDVYGVALTRAMKIEINATQAARARLRAESIAESDV